MQPFVKVLALSTLCLVSACSDTKRVVEHLPTPPERLVCERAGTRPTLPPEHVIIWERLLTAPTVAEAVKRAHDEHMEFVKVLRTREGLVAGYILKVEGELFKCWNNMEWRRQYEAGIGG